MATVESERVSIRGMPPSFTVHSQTSVSTIPATTKGSSWIRAAAASALSARMMVKPSSAVDPPVAFDRARKKDLPGLLELDHPVEMLAELSAGSARAP